MAKLRDMRADDLLSALSATERSAGCDSQSAEMLRAEVLSRLAAAATLKRRLSDVADAFGADPEDQRELCVRAREAGAKIEILKRERDRLQALVGRLSADGLPVDGA